MDAALEEIEFLARSKNRVEVLRLLAAESHTRGSLGEATGASQATLGRILEDFTERSWVRREGGEYAATATGTLVAEGIDEFLEILGTEAKLRDVVKHLPADAVGFDLRRLADASVTVPSRTRPSAPLQRVLGVMGDAEALRVFSHAFNEQSLAVAHERVVTGEQTFEGVFSKRAIAALSGEAALWRQVRELAAAENARIRIREDDIPLAVTIAGGTVHLLVRDDGGLLQASIHTDDEAVHSWAVGTFERYWEASVEFDPAAFEP